MRCRRFRNPISKMGGGTSLRDETLCDVELDLLRFFKEVCIKHGLTYYAMGGTLLGAVREHGFIPWDDDIDVMMPYPDYKKLLQVSGTESVYPYFFQSHLTEKEKLPDMIKLRRSDTTGCTKWEVEAVSGEYNRGIFLDIIPFFNVPDREGKRKRLLRRIMFYWKLIRGYDGDRELKATGRLVIKESYKKYVYLYRLIKPFIDITTLKQKYLDVCNTEKSETECVQVLSFISSDENYRWKREWLSHPVEIPFENTTIPCPQGYEALLTKQYGNWKEPVKNSDWHGQHYLLSTRIPYSEHPDVIKELATLRKPIA